jgi:predicted transcriptional regulator
MKSLYELTHEARRIEEVLCGMEDGEIPDDLEQVLSIHAGQAEEKVEAYCRVIANRAGRLVAIKAELDRLKKAEHSEQSIIDSLEKRLKEYMTASGTKEFYAGTFALKIKNNGGKVPLIIDETKEIPKLFTREVTETVIDKELIRKWLDAGCELPFAKLGERGTRLEIK